MQFLIPIIFIIPFCITLYSCKNDKQKIRALTPPLERPTYKSKDVSILYSDSTRLKAILTAQQMINYDKNQTDPFVFFPNTIQVIFYNESQVPTSTLTAQQAIYFTKTQKAYLKYNVHFINDKQEHLMTENLKWDQETGKITSDKAVKIITPTQIINGYGIECEEDFSEYTIKNITGIVQINND